MTVGLVLVLRALYRWGNKRRIPEGGGFGELVKKVKRLLYGKKASGHRWKNVGSEPPKKGEEIENELLAEALQEKTVFTRAEWDTFEIKALYTHFYIRSGDSFFQPDVKPKAPKAPKGRQLGIGKLGKLGKRRAPSPPPSPPMAPPAVPSALSTALVPVNAFAPTPQVPEERVVQVMKRAGDPIGIGLRSDGDALVFAYVESNSIFA